MTLPSVEVTISDVPGAGRSPTNIATLYAAGYADRGPAEAVRVTSMSQYRSTFGDRVSYSSLYDALAVFFREGGGEAYVSRILGPNPVVATADAQDATPADSFRVDAASPGEWGNDLDVTIDATGATFTISVSLDGTVVETSPALATPADAASWSDSSSYVTITDLGGADPVDQTLSLVSGADDRTNVTDAELTAALDLFTSDLGPGQVAMPGVTSAGAHAALLAHAEANKRNALIDFDDTNVVGTVVAAATALRADTGNRFSGGFWPWDVAPGDTPGTTRVVPPSARNAALFARAVRETGGEVGRPAAGGRYPATFVTGLSQAGISDDDRELLNDGGINVSIARRGEVLTYGNRTLTSAVADPNWSQLNQSRVIAALAAEAGEIGADYVHSKIDGQGLELGEFAGRLQGLCGAYFARGDLYGADAEDAFQVSVEAEFGAGTATILGTIDARVSPGAELVKIVIYKNPIA